MPEKPLFPAPTLPVPDCIVSLRELGMLVFSGWVGSTATEPAAVPCKTGVQNDWPVALYMERL